MPPDVENAFRDTDVINSGTVVTYTCNDEFVYINGDTSREAYCDYETLQWTNVPNACVGMYATTKCLMTSFAI